MNISRKTCIICIFTPCYCILFSALHSAFDNCSFTAFNSKFSRFNSYFNVLILLRIFTSILSLIITSCCLTLSEVYACEQLKRSTLYTLNLKIVATFMCSSFGCMWKTNFTSKVFKDCLL